LISVPLFIFLTLELLIVSWGDIKTQKIPNYWSVLNLIIFVGLLIALPEVYPLTWGTFLYSLVFLVVGFLLFILKIMGAGDTKFLFSFFLLIPAAIQPKALILLLLSTVLIGSFLLITNFIKNHEKIVVYIKTGYFKGIKECFGTKFSFAPVILIAWLWLGWEIKIF
jgi:prepilin peptidase CpaA